MTPEEAFSGKKPNVENIRIFGCPVYSHIPKGKRNKLEPSGKKGIFVGYSDSSKAYKIYILEQHKIKVNKDVTFNERMAFRKSIEENIEEEDIEELNEENIENVNDEKELLDHPMEPCENIDSDIEEEEEIEELNEENIENVNDEKELLDHPMEPCENIDSDIVPKTKKRPSWLEDTLQNEERLKVPEGTFRKSKRPKIFSSYATYMTKLLDEETTTFEEAVQKGQWK
jgi:hypothetical protein